MDCWDLFKVYAVSAKEDSRDFWEQYTADEYEIYEKHGFTPLAKGLLIESRKEIMRILEGRRDK